MTPADRAWELLADGLTPQAIIHQLTPTTKSEAIHLARRIPLLAERPDGDRGAAMVRLATRIGMRRFHLFFTPDGRVADDPAYIRPHPSPAKRELPGDGCTVEYTRRYFPDKDHFQFVGTPSGEADKWGVVPRQPIPLSGTGYWSHFAEPDAVTALGGPEAFLAALTAVGRDGAKAFEEAFVGKLPEPGRGRRALPVVGEHTAKVVTPVPPVNMLEEPPSSGQPDLFSQTGEQGRGR